MYRVDLHTHSQASPDGALTTGDYLRMLEGGLHCVAVTDHNTISFAQELHASLGERIIVGEEITTAEGEVIGLFLKEAVPAGLSLAKAVEAIKAQGGLVYVPHPFETVRSGVPEAALNAVAKDVDIIEVQNGRAVFQNRSARALEWAAAHNVPGAASSDSHGRHGWGRTYSEVAALPTQKTLTKLLAEARLVRRAPGVRGMLYPKFNRLTKVREKQRG
jgi:predicted metal-dependent phosphoesterase TrpH